MRVEREHIEAVAIFATHGVADTLSTLAAHRSDTKIEEANPLIRQTLNSGELLTAAVILSVVAFASVLWPTAARLVGRRPASAVAAVVVTIGAVVSITNMAVASGLL